MANEFSIELRGLPEIDEALAQLGPVAGEKIIRSTLMAAAVPMENRAKMELANIRSGSGALHKATRRVYLKAGSSARGGAGSSTATRFVVAIAPKTKDRIAMALANLKYKRKRPIRGIFWGHLIEWGHVTRSGTKVRGLRPFTRAFEGGSLESVVLFRRLIGERVRNALNRARKIKKRSK